LPLYDKGAGFLQPVFYSHQVYFFLLVELLQFPSLIMPQSAQQQQQPQKKNKKRTPKYQNKFAFEHNLKSKKTAIILASPITHFCRRCHDKIEWRKQYRKYKPLTQPAKCNGCQKRNVLAAYHTICTACTTGSAKAKEIIQAKKGTTTPLKSSEEAEEQQLEDQVRFPKTLRVCAMCVKEIALPDPLNAEEELIQETGRIQLRQRKALERRLERVNSRPSSSKNTTISTTVEEDNEDESSVDSYPEVADQAADDDDELDPFLQAVGGADKLLTGEAYQQKLLAQQHIHPTL
jgi:hypothetical protein